MKKKYENLNTDQRINSRQYLKVLIFKSRENVEVRQYCRQYFVISTRLKKRGRMNEYTQVLWFLQDLSKHVAKKIMKKHEWSEVENYVVDFDVMFFSTVKICDSDQAIKKIQTIMTSFSTLSALTDEIQSRVSNFSMLEAYKQILMSLSITTDMNSLAKAMQELNFKVNVYSFALNLNQKSDFSQQSLDDVTN